MNNGMIISWDHLLLGAMKNCLLSWKITELKTCPFRKNTKIIVLSGIRACTNTGWTKEKGMFYSLLLNHHAIWMKDSSNPKLCFTTALKKQKSKQLYNQLFFLKKLLVFVHKYQALKLTKKQLQHFKMLKRVAWQRALCSLKKLKV